MKATRLVCGVGVLDAGYKVQDYKNYTQGGRTRKKLLWTCPFYLKWVNLLSRVYRPKADRPTYSGCSIHPEWLVFSNFKAWMMSQDWEGKALDKDLLVRGNKHYSPDTCIFVTQAVNSFMNDHAKKRGLYPIGVDFHKKVGRFRARINVGSFKSSRFLGYFDDPGEAHEAWRQAKHNLACELADTCSDQRLSDSLRGMYNESHN